jgi:hypothetical protein
LLHTFCFGGQLNAMAVLTHSVPGFLIWLFWVLVGVILVVLAALVIHHFGGASLSLHIGDFFLNVGVS